MDYKLNTYNVFHFLKLVAISIRKITIKLPAKIYKFTTSE